MEEIFGWIKTITGLRKTRHQGKRRGMDIHLRGGSAQSGSNERTWLKLRLKTSMAPCYRASDIGHPKENQSSHSV